MLQKDGNIVDTDSGPVKFLGVPEGNYRIAIRHRNHLGVMTANNKTMNFGVPVSINFTNNTEPVEGGLTNLNYVSGGSNPAYVLIKVMVIHLVMFLHLTMLRFGGQIIVKM
ncbi:MAG: hypothetical protein IPJ13_04915 [Saprospiraceae bacterium]|nr:hypothetical protein [Saprospiraceae bacterium]